jgi:peptide/nickel transport system permease protein
MTDLPRSPESPVPAARPSRWRNIWTSDLVWRFRHSPVAIVAAIVALALVSMAVFAPWLAPYNPFNPATLNLMDGMTPPNSESYSGRYFVFGTDNQGRDVLSTIMYGSRISLFVGVMATLFAMLLGVGLGLVSGYVGGIVDAVIMRIADVQLSFPAILIAL